MIYLRFITEKWALDSALIRLGTRSWASHVEFVYCSNTTDSENPHGVPTGTLGSRLDGGVQVRPYTYCRPTREEWYTAPHIEDAYEFGKRLIGSKYDLTDILGIGADEDWHTDGRYICSEFIARCGEAPCQKGDGCKFENDPWLNFTTPAWHITPRDLLCFAPLTFVRRVL